MVKITVPVTIELAEMPSKNELKQYIKEAIHFFGGGLHPDDIMFANVKKVSCGKIQEYSKK